MQAIKGIAKQAGLDSAQTAASESVDYLIDMLLNGDASEYEYAAAQYMEQHPEASAREAKEAVLAQKAKEIARDMATSFGTGVLTGSAATAGGYLKNTFMDTPSEYAYGDWADDETPDGKTHFDEGDIETDEVPVENDGKVHKSGGVAVAEKGETENGSTIDENRLYSPEPDDINADIKEATVTQNDNKYYQVNIHGNKNTELDEVDLNTGIIYEDKCALKLYMENPDFPQTEWDWADKQIYKKGGKRIDALMQES